MVTRHPPAVPDRRRLLRVLLIGLGVGIACHAVVRGVTYWLYPSRSFGPRVVDVRAEVDVASRELAEAGDATGDEAIENLARCFLYPPESGYEWRNLMSFGQRPMQMQRSTTTGAGWIPRGCPSGCDTTAGNGSWRCSRSASEVR